MSDTSPRLNLPFIQAAQAQKHITHNEAIRLLDAIVQLSVEAFGTETPPVVPADGETHAIGASPVGLWAGHAGELAVWLDAAWTFIAPQEGWIAATVGTGEISVYSAGTWSAPVVSVDLQNLAGVGINATSDSTNRLAVSGDATLLNHDGTDHQLKINKASATDTASLLFQSNWSGRAEMGLSGSDDFSIKVSADGSTWNDALSVPAGENVLTTANMVGTVAAGGGAGASVIETDSGTNGTYTKFADGTMICALQGFASSSAAAATWTLPASFVDTAYATTATIQGATPAVATVSGETTSSVDIETFDLSGSDTVTPLVNVIAVGRWA